MIAPPRQEKKCCTDRAEKKADRSLLLRIASIVLAIIGLCAISFLLLHVDKTPSGDQETKSPPKIKLQSAKVETVAKPQVPATVSEENEVVVSNETWLGQPVVKHEHKTNNTLIVETIYTADGKKHKYYHDQREEALPSGADQILAMMTANNGFGAPPLPQISNFENDFGDAIKIPIEINDTDSKEIKELKERVIAARKELLDLMAEGYSANDVIKDWERMQEDNATVRMEAVRNVRELLKEGDREGAQALCDEYNKVLEKAGIMTIELPPERK